MIIKKEYSTCGVCSEKFEVTRQNCEKGCKEHAYQYCIPCWIQENEGKTCNKNH